MRNWQSLRTQSIDSLRTFISGAREITEHQAMSKAFGLFFAGSCVIANIAPSTAADADHGKQIAQRWCASCHLVDPRQASATDQAPPFTYLARMPNFDENKLAFLLLLPHPNMPNVSLNRAEVADLADYIQSLK